MIPAFALGAALGIAAPASAELKIEHAVYASMAAADLTSTLHCQQLGCVETNPAIAWIQPHGTAPMVAVGAALELGALWAGHRWIGRKHPKVERVVLWAVSGLRVAIVRQNLKEAGKQQRWNARPW